MVRGCCRVFIAQIFLKYFKSIIYHFDLVIISDLVLLWGCWKIISPDAKDRGLHNISNIHDGSNRSDVTESWFNNDFYTNISSIPYAKYELVTAMCIAQ